MKINSLKLGQLYVPTYTYMVKIYLHMYTVKNYYIIIQY